MVAGPWGPQRQAPPSNGAFAVMSLNAEDVIMLNYDLSPFYRSTVGFDLAALDAGQGWCRRAERSHLSSTISSGTSETPIASRCGRRVQ